MIGYLDMPAGISGDMFLGCLVDAGWPIEQLRAALSKLKLPASDWSVESRQVMKGVLRATLVDVRVTEGPQPLPMQHKFVLNPSAHDHGGGHSHRNLDDIRGIINRSDLPNEVKEKSIAVFIRLANAEAKVHGTTVDQIHFHEVGALDAIVDIVGSVAGVYELGIEQLYASAFPLGGGWTNSQHGQIPLPAPATLELLSAAGAPTRKAPGDGELVTPTGAALVCELASFEQPPMRLEKAGLGAGQRDTAWPNIARLWLGASIASSSENSANRTLVQIETNIDDMNPQFYAPLSDRLFAIGALDVWLVPIQMKKNRPAVTLCVLAPANLQPAITDLIMRETTTLGLRIVPVNRVEAEREFKNVETPFGSVKVKLKRWNNQIIGATPEYEDCRRLAEANHVPLKQVYDAAISAAHLAYLAKSL
jgi:uncharacterized protein (TIGR00299 family) protein